MGGGIMTIAQISQKHGCQIQHLSPLTMVNIEGAINKNILVKRAVYVIIFKK